MKTVADENYCLIQFCMDDGLVSNAAIIDLNAGVADCLENLQNNWNSSYRANKFINTAIELTGKMMPCEELELLRRRLALSTLRFSGGKWKHI